MTRPKMRGHFGQISQAEIERVFSVKWSQSSKIGARIFSLEAPVKSNTGPKVSAVEKNHKKMSLHYDVSWLIHYFQ